MQVHQRVALEARSLPVIGVQSQEFPEGECLALQPLGVLIVRQHVRQLVAEHGPAAGLERDHGGAGVDLLSQAVEHALQQASRQGEHPVVVQRPAAAERLPRDDHLVAGGLEDLGRGDRHLGMEVVVERVRP
jgi:hypothetical protein